MLISVDEFRRYLGGYEPPDGLQLEMVDVLQGTQQQLEVYLNRPVELVQVREIAYSDAIGRIYLSVTPVHKILSLGTDVTLSSAPSVTTTPYTMTADPSIGDEGRVIDRAGWRNRSNFRPGGLTVTYPNLAHVVEYVGGIDGNQHEDIKLAIKRVAAREYTQGHVDTAGLRVGQIEDVEAGDSRNPGWTNGELKSLERYRRRLFL